MQVARRGTLAALVVVLFACGKKNVPVANADASAPVPIQCWRRSGIKPPGPRPEIAKALLAKGAMRVYLDPRRAGVAVPDRFRHDIRIDLLFGQASVPDLKVDDEALSGTLPIDGQPFTCRIPWPSVYALTSNEDDAASGGVWEESVPADLFCRE